MTFFTKRSFFFYGDFSEIGGLNNTKCELYHGHCKIEKINSGNCVVIKDERPVFYLILKIKMFIAKGYAFLAKPLNS